uniref:Uncharacterized protein n=1 Tax=Arundo donax TaxID=35708 RepID=A0A0A9BHJ9_ARUDO
MFVILLSLLIRCSRIDLPRGSGDYGEAVWLRHLPFQFSFEEQLALID